MTSRDMDLRACPMGTWEAADALPHPRLRPGVLAYRGFRLALNRPRLRLEAPISAATLVLAFEEHPITLTRSDRPDRPLRRMSVLSGLRTCATLAGHGGRLYGVEVSLAPWMAFALFDADQSDLAAESVDPLLLPGGRIAALTDALAEAPCWQHRFRMLDAALAAWAATGPRPAPQIVRAWTLLSRSGGTLPIPRLADDVGWGVRQLEHRFQQQIGQRPKAAARVLRMQRARRQLARGRSQGAVAAACGFYDQAHLCREFKAMTGLTPTAFMEGRASLPGGGPPVDRLPGETTSLVLAG
ncbi:helix-turn-helix domain-containing protein [Streptomyces sp. NBC_01180]|uniref:helix-turn-helix domain-containing protein n=1 Tax=Streptomyces sp. NBC_01180 TaxID=2903763 RepID=UPI0038680217|nr:helix-turn-helix transcriptional regulator [Streptomyces sp. NBC_01180]